MASHEPFPHQAGSSSTSASTPNPTSAAAATSSGGANGGPSNGSTGGAASDGAPNTTDPDAVFTMPMDEEWLADDSVLVPPGADPNGDFAYDFTIEPATKNYVNAKATKSAARRDNDDPYNSTPPKLKKQVIKCNNVAEFRLIILQRFGRAIMGLAKSNNMDLMLVPVKDRGASDVLTNWRLVPASVSDLEHFFYINHKNRLYFFFGTETPAWAVERDYATVGRSLLTSLHGSTIKLHICRLGFHLQSKPDYDAFVKAVRQPRNTDRAGAVAQADINDLIRRMQLAHPNLSREPPSSWQQWAAEIAALPRDRQEQAIAHGPPATLPFSNAEAEAQRRLQNMYESNVFLEHIAGDAAEAVKKIDSMLDALVSSVTKDFENSLKAAVGKIKEEIAKTTLSLNKQAQVARWNAGAMAPAHPSMPPALVGATAASALAAHVPGSVEQFDLNSDEDQSDQDHTGDEDEGDDEIDNSADIGLAA